MTFANRYVQIEKEATFDTAPSSTIGPAYGECDDEGFQENFDNLTRNDMNRYGAAKSLNSKHYAEGSFSMAAQPDYFTMKALHGLYGTHTPGGTPGTGDTLTEGGTLPSYTFRIGREEKSYTYSGQVIESVAVSANIGEYAMMSFSTTGAAGSNAVASLLTPAYDYTGDAAHFAACYVNFEDVAETGEYSKLVQSIDFEIKTNRDLDNSYGLGSSTCIRAPPEQRREITGTITFHKAVLAADVADTEPTWNELAAGLTQDGAAATPALSVLLYVGTADFIRFDFTKVVYDAPSTNVSGRDSQTMTVGFTALYDAGEACMSKITFNSSSTKFAGGGAVDLDGA